MKVSNIIINEKLKVRIDHPEDLVWRMGSSGFELALNALEYAQDNPENIQLKWDGTPSLIWGFSPDDGEFTLTDKTGFNSTSYNGFPETKKEVFDMFYRRNPTQESRKKFALTIASLWDLLKDSTPKDNYGFYQGDLLYVNTHEVNNNYVEFKPNKILYRIPVNTGIGRYIANSDAGIAVHSFLEDKETENPVPVKDIKELQKNPRLAILPTNIQITNDFDVEKISIENYKIIDKFLNKSDLRSKKISDLPDLIGKYINYMARNGINDFKNSPKNFLEWLSTESRTNVLKQDRIKKYIKENKQSYVKLWQCIYSVVNYKENIKSYIDSNINLSVYGFLDNNREHEGYVVNTPYGKIKLVDRHIFMKKD